MLAVNYRAYLPAQSINPVERPFVHSGALQLLVVTGDVISDIVEPLIYNAFANRTGGWNYDLRAVVIRFALSMSIV